MDKEILELQFKNIKNQILKSNDISRKGNVDNLIVGIVDKLNCHNDLVTTSSCSGRVIVVSKTDENQKEGCEWIYISHSEVNEIEFIESIKKEIEKGQLVVKFEPFILHIQCRTLQVAKCILTCALQNGYRNSGIVIGKHGKIMLAVRNTLNMEVPISANGQLLVTEKFLSYLCNQANQKMKKNYESVNRFEEALSIILSGIQTDPSTI